MNLMALHNVVHLRYNGLELVRSSSADSGYMFGKAPDSQTFEPDLTPEELDQALNNLGNDL